MSLRAGTAAGYRGGALRFTRPLPARHAALTMIEEDAAMRIGSLRLLTICAAALALAVPAALSARNAQAERGVVQSVNANQIILRALDGSTVSFRLLPSTRVRVNGAKASATDVTPGAVAEVMTDRKGRATLIRAFSPQTSAPSTVTETGVVTQATKSSLSY